MVRKTLEDKLNIINQFDEGKQASDLVDEHLIDQSQVYKWSAQKDSIVSVIKGNYFHFSFSFSFESNIKTFFQYFQVIKKWLIELDYLMKIISLN